ncbi:PAS domain-containing protein [Sphingomonas sp. NIBR02145]|uniref:PAS domain-containing protein n=1 Tax=Sphingomonas sp. NIBR02145 TaxID=3014784 RepID=UPI0022B51CA7|nr:PAS domain-containing protein [Sphingomonas sp. NIBR02145]WHU02412.1 PAS domain-containing protein [Sphingomonas sp. NIBR02145]
MAILQMIEASATAAVISDPRQPDNPIVACNAAFLELTGYARDDVIGRNCRFLSGPDTEPALSETLRTGIRNRQPVLVEILNYRKDGSAFRNAVMVAPIFDAEGELEYFLGSQVALAERPSDAATRQSVARQRIDGLSPRQREILKMMSGGKLNKQIAHALQLSERTVKMHRAALLQALGVRANADAIRLAVEAGF